MEKLSDKEWLALRRYSTAPLSEVWRDAIDIVLAQRPVSYTAEDALVEALENVDSTLCVCRHNIPAKGCNCDVHAAHRLIDAALKLVKEERNG